MSVVRVQDSLCPHLDLVLECTFTLHIVKYLKGGSGHCMVYGDLDS